MSENSSIVASAPSPRASAPTCLCELAVDENGKWQLKPESTTECVTTVESMAATLGPNSREYLATHITPDTPEMQEAVKKLKTNHQRPE